jgi:uncharacterized protein YgiM (DUF1202 family)
MTEKFKLYWPVDSHRVNQFFGENPQFYQKFGLDGHEGLDLRAPTGANIYAAAEGLVYFAGHPENHPYGLLIRIKHEHEGEIYRTIYAHLKEIFVKEGQKVRVGELIGLADNTGNSFGSHLHLTLVKDGAQIAGYTNGIIDPWPYLQATETPPPDASTPPPSDLVVYTTVELNMRAQANTTSAIRGLLGVGEPLTVLGDAEAARSKIGREGEWIQVQAGSHLTGFIAAWFVEIIDNDAAPSDLIVYPNMKLNVRAGRSLEATILGTVSEFDALVVLGDTETMRLKVGQKNEWLHIQTDKGLKGFVAAEAVRFTGEVAATCGLTVYPTDILNLRARATTESNILVMVTPSDPLQVLGDFEQAYERIGQPNEWLNVETSTGSVGYVSAEFVQTSEQAAFGEIKEQPYLGVYAKRDTILQAQAAKNSPKVSDVPANTELDVLDPDLNAARQKVGQSGQWLFVRNVDDYNRGWVRTDDLKL